MPFMRADDAADFGAGEDGREAAGALGADDGVEVGKRLSEDVAVEKEKRAQGLGLGGRADGAFDGEVGDEGVDLGLAHLGGMALVVKEDVARIQPT